MAQSNYQYALELRRQDGSKLRQVPIAVDWDPVEQCCLFEAQRKGHLGTNRSPANTNVLVEPIWDSKIGEPYLSGFKVIASNNGQKYDSEFPTAFFQSLAEEASVDFVKNKELDKGEHFGYFVLAFRHEQVQVQAVEGNTSVETMNTKLPLCASKLCNFKERATPFGKIDKERMPVFIPYEVIEEIRDLTLKAGTLETGGVFIGFLNQDADSPEIFLEITAQISAQHTRAEITKLTFTPETWSDVRSAIKLRGQNEQMIGWWHCHNFLSEGVCQNPSNCTCKKSALFLSPDDCNFHRTCFPRAYNVSFVMAHTPGGISYALYSWQHGMIRQRGFHILSNAQNSSNTILETI